MMKRLTQANPQKLLVGIIVVAVLLRVGAALKMGDTIVDLPGIFDQVSYHNLALRVLGGHGFSFGEQWWPATAANAPTAHWSYLYTLWLTAVYAIFGPHPLIARLIQAVAAGILMPWLLYRLARLTISPRLAAPYDELAALAAAAISAIYIYFVYYAGALITESFYIIAVLWAFDLAVRISQSEQTGWRQWVWLGVALGTAVLLRQLFLLFIPFLLLWLWWGKRPSLVRLVLPLVITFLMMLPFTIRNYRVFHKFVPLNTNSGYALFWGNHPIYGTKFIPILPPEMGSYYSLIPQELLDKHLNEAELESALLQRGLQFVIDDPVRYVLLSLSRIPPYFIFWPSAQSGLISNISRVGSFGLFLPFMLFGLYRSLRQPFPSWRARLASPYALFYLFFLAYTGMHVLTWTLVRYRLPIDAVLILFAGWAVVELVAKLTHGRSSS
jgi:4-amino-4-deoxy-L-arabinose transferase-like glycosyltransferase